MANNWDYRKKLHYDYQAIRRKFTTDHGGRWYDPTIECRMPYTMKRDIGFYINDITAFHIRDFADDFHTYGERFSHYEDYKIMQDDPKNGIVGRVRDNTMLEGIALVIHVHEARIGIKSLYCIQDPFTGEEYGILLSNRDSTNEFGFLDDKVWWPKQQLTNPRRNELQNLFDEVFYDRNLWHYDWPFYGESPDPFVVVENRFLEPLDTFWAQLIPGYQPRQKEKKSLGDLFWGK